MLTRLASLTLFIRKQMTAIHRGRGHAAPNWERCGEEPCAVWAAKLRHAGTIEEDT